MVHAGNERQRGPGSVYSMRIRVLADARPRREPMHQKSNIFSAGATMSDLSRPPRLPFMPMTRREMLMSAGCGFGYLALRGMCSHSAAQEAAQQFLNPLAAKRPPLPAKAKRVIMLFMQGGPS